MSEEWGVPENRNQHVVSRVEYGWVPPVGASFIIIGASVSTARRHRSSVDARLFTCLLLTEWRSGAGVPFLTTLVGGTEKSRSTTSSCTTGMLRMHVWVAVFYGGGEQSSDGLKRTNVGSRSYPGGEQSIMHTRRMPGPWRPTLPVLILKRAGLKYSFHHRLFSSSGYRILVTLHRGRTHIGSEEQGRSLALGLRPHRSVNNLHGQRLCARVPFPVRLN